MSAFVVEARTINRLVSFIARQAESTKYDRCEVGEVLKAGGVAAHELDWKQRLAASLLILNTDAVNDRYDEADYPDVSFTYCHKSSTDVQALKSLSCFLYQCSEGEIPERPLYKALEDLKAQLAYSIVSRLPEYNAAAWE